MAVALLTLSYAPQKEKGTVRQYTQFLFHVFFIHKSRVGALPCEVRCFYERAYNGSSNSTKSYSLVCVCTRVSELFQAAIFVLAAAATAAADTAVTTAARSRAREIIGNSLKV